MQHEGCILPYLANGVCPQCGAEKRLELPDNIQVRVLKPTVIWEGLWDYHKADKVWSFFALPKPSEYTLTADNSTTVWLPFWWVKATTTAPVTVVGEMLNGHLGRWLGTGRAQRFYQDLEPQTVIEGLAYAGGYPVSIETQRALGILDRAKTCQDLLACETEDLAAHHQIPAFNYPSTSEAVMALANHAASQHAFELFYDPVDMSYVLQPSTAFRDISVDILLVPVHVGHIDLPNLRYLGYMHLAVGAGKGISDLPFDKNKKSVIYAACVFAFIFYWFAIFFTLAIRDHIAFAIVLLFGPGALFFFWKYLAAI